MRIFIKHFFFLLLIYFLSFSISFAQLCTVDMFIANDQSGSVSALENTQSRQFITALMQGMQPWGNGQGESRMAVADWSSPGVWTQFSYPSAGQNYTTLLTDVISYQTAPRTLSGGTGPYSALLNTYNSINQTPVPGRVSNKIIVLMTDAACSQVPAGISALATQIKNAGVFIIVVAIESASSCPTLAGTNVASPGGYFSASNYASLIQANVQLVQNIITTACIGPPSPSYDLLIALDSYTAVNCTTGTGTYTVNYTVTNSQAAGAIFNDEILISFYNGDPKLTTTNLLAVQNAGIQSIPIGGTYSGTFTNPLFASSATVYAIVNYNGSLIGNQPPVPPNFVGATYVIDEFITFNNFSNGIIRVGDPSCPPNAIITTNVQSGSVGCDNIVSYEVTICNTGDASAFITTTLPIPVPGAVQINNNNVPVDSTGFLEWATYYGDSNIDHSYGVATDPAGNVYITGFSESDANIATAGAYQTIRGGNKDAFLAKFDTDGNRLWGTYFGGDENDEAYDVATDNAGNVYIVGSTQSDADIATAGAHQTVYNNSDDGFIAKFNSSGVLQWASYYGGTGDDFVEGVATDASGNVYFAGYTTDSSIAIASAGSHQTVIGGNTDLFLVKFNSSGSRQWGTYYGGAEEDLEADVATDPTGNVYLTGRTQSNIGMATGGSHQMINNGDDDFVLAKFNSAGVRQWGTYYGGTQTERFPCVATDLAGNIYLGGETNSLNFISAGTGHQLTIGGLWDAFLVKFNTGGVRQWGTYYGGTGLDAARGVTTDASGNAFITGPTTSANGIATAGTFQSILYGQDAFLAKFNSIGENKWGTYYGGPLTEEGFGIATDAVNSIYISGVTASSINIATSAAHQTIYGTLEDAFLAKFNERDIGSILLVNECITRQYIYDLSAVAPGTYNFSFGVIADTVNAGDAAPVILPDTNFTVATYTNVDGFNGALHSSDDITLIAGGPPCPLGDQITISVDIPPSVSCAGGHFVQATVTIINTSGTTVFDTDLHLNLTGLGATFAGELYNISANLIIPAPAILATAYPAVPYALFSKSGDQYLPIYEIPPDTSTFHVDINVGSAFTNLSAQIDSIHSAFNASGQSNLAFDAQGLTISPYPIISGFNCPASINLGSSIIFNGISASNSGSVAWSSTSVATIPNAGTLANPSITYTPTPVDIANGYVAISLTVTSAAGCETTMACQIIINNVLYDYGDAPISFDQNVNIQPIAAASTLLNGLYIGQAAPGTENIANSSAIADGDGLEEDGLPANPVLTPFPGIGQPFNLSIEVTNNSNDAAYLSAFIDWGADGDFLDSTESALAILPVPAFSGAQQYVSQFIVPLNANIISGIFFIRLRLSTDSLAIKWPYLAAPNGETEDYFWNPNPPLPIQLVHFAVDVLDNNTVRINWKTASEINNDFFTIEKSKDAIIWEEFKEIEGAGNSNYEIFYEEIDTDPYFGISYYRLKQTDFDGAFSYSHIETVEISSMPASESDKIIIYPNPCESDARLFIGGINIEHQVHVQIELSTFDSKRVEKFELNNTNSFDISELGLKPGLYVLTIIARTMKYQTKIIIRD